MFRHPLLSIAIKLEQIQKHFRLKFETADGATKIRECAHVTARTASG